ncbi:SEC-C metal-binding domain-containing protein [Micromonospora sp. WMMD1120]|uniref:SEC-C metal-binding domain-containing protein n=1 Tax=Micromonospora sp. WMMD1120 TaxID=3016106 RepID=UPI002417E0D0|nr:SEC-C metal-binding domain-containing protein [Micromonospora sp. WMMD1120]MDG4805241.1 SEC-C metal-binding domain-containing protein [Micromonospora sp. WMMD1120]
MSELLTADRIDEIGATGPGSPDPAALVTELVSAVDEGRVADPADTGYALLVAADILRQAGDLADALALATRAIAEQPDDDAYARAVRAGLLLRLDRTDEGLAELTALRPLLETDPDAAYLIDELAGAGHTDTAVEWLTGALDVLLERSRAQQHESEDAQDAAAAMIYGLAQQRHDLREDMGLPHDEYDTLADRLRDAASHALDALDDGPATLLFWPKAEFDALLVRWPALAESYPTTWDGHRAQIERAFVETSGLGGTGLGVVAGSVDGLAAFAGTEPIDEETLDEYADSLEDTGVTSWPPGRNDTCWCGSGTKYKKCCLPRSRA